MIVTDVTKYNGSIIPITGLVTQSHDIEKVIEDSEADDVIQHGYNILALWKAHSF